MTIQVKVTNNDMLKDVTIKTIEHLKDSPNIILSEKKSIIKPLHTEIFNIYDRRSILITEEKEEVDNV